MKFNWHAIGGAIVSALGWTLSIINPAAVSPKVAPWLGLAGLVYTTITAHTPPADTTK